MNAALLDASGGLDEPERGLAHEDLPVKAPAPRERCDVAVIVARSRRIVAGVEALPDRRAHVGIGAVLEQQFGKGRDEGATLNSRPWRFATPGSQSSACRPARLDQKP